MRSRCGGMVFLILTFLGLLEDVCPFNFDTSFPIVYVDPYSLTGQLDKTSYFGYSVLLYGGDEASAPWVQIGAPRGKNRYAQNETTGVVFRCGIKTSCDYIPMDPIVPAGNSGEAYFGNSMDISDNKDIYAVCGHRWITQVGSEYFMQGACFGGRTNETQTDFFRPLFGQSSQTTLVAGVRVYNKALAQLGFSAQFAKNKNELIIGMPGLLNWKGAPGILSRPSSPEPARRRSKRAIDELSEVLVPEVVSVDQIKYFDLGGYSVTSGRFYSRGFYMVTGAPRASQTGSVLIFLFNASKMVIKERKDGTRMGEYFGSSVAATDLSGDGLDDLVVGAPFRKGTGSDMKYDGGAIYIYLGSKEKLVDATTNMIEGRATGGRFGEAIMALGDIDKDGCRDIAVSAPYENEDSGVVYIFRGHRTLGLVKEPSQVIAGKEIVPTIKGFGISLSKPADVDGNNYEDLAVGAYQSGHAILFRAKPVVVLSHTLSSSVSQISAQNHTNTDNTDATAFNISSCVSFSGENIHPPIEVVRSITVDKGVSDRAYVDGRPNYDSTLMVPSQQYCQIYTVKIKKSNNNVYDPIVIRGLVDLKKVPETRSIITVTDKTDGQDNFCPNCAILRTTEDTTKQISIDFNRGCGDDNVCDSELALSATFTDLSDGVYVVGSKEYIIMETRVTNSKENAFQTEVTIVLPSAIRLKRLSQSCTESYSEITCTIENPLKMGSTGIVKLELDLDEVNSGKYEKDLDFTLRVRTSSNNHGEFEKKLSLKLTKNANVELIGKSSEETYSYSNRTYGIATFYQTYKILKYDISPIQKVQLNITVPTQLSFDGRDVNFLSLYAPSGTIAGQIVTCKTTIDTISDNEVPTAVGDIEKKKRKRRDITATEEILLKYPANRTIYFNCSMEGVHCGAVLCDFGPFKNVKHIAEVKLKMVLNISELTNYFPEKDIVIVSTSGQINIADKVSNNNGYSHKVAVPSVFIGPSAEQSIATWIIIVAIICGILLLAIVAGILYKLGFFERKKKDLLIEEKAKQQSDGQSDPLHPDETNF